MPVHSLFLLVVSLFFAVSVLGAVYLSLSTGESITKVTFLNVGQGDAILIQDGKNQILIDGGKSGKTLLGRVGRHVPFWDRNIEVVIATHPDSDHIGGFPDLLKVYRTGVVLTNGATSDTETSRLFEESSEKAALGKHKFFAPGKIELPSGGELLVEYPKHSFSGNVEETNQTSIVSRFRYGETTFLLTGDLASEEEALPSEEPVTFLKAAHHGSRYSTSNVFLDLVKPKEAIISVGKNSYGHPSEEVLKRLSEHQVSVRRTDEEGDIRYECRPKEKKCVSVK